jgi:prevent-host-death family protein
MVTNMVTRPARAKAPPETISAAEFKAKCLELMDAVATTGASVLVTKRGRPVARLSPVRARRGPGLGFMKGRIRILGDIMSPIDATWDADA